MQRVTISVDDALADAFDAIAKSKSYASRSEAVRDLLRAAVLTEHSGDDGFCVANLSYVYNHHERDLASRLMEVQHQHHDLVMNTSHVHLDHEHCLESVMLKGPTAQIRKFAEEIEAQRGVRHGLLNVIPVDPGDRHDQDHGHTHAGAAHLSPRRG